MNIIVNQKGRLESCPHVMFLVVELFMEEKFSEL